VIAFCRVSAVDVGFDGVVGVDLDGALNGVSALDVDGGDPVHGAVKDHVNATTTFKVNEVRGQACSGLPV